MLLSQQRITARAEDLFRCSPHQEILKWYLPDRPRYWVGSAREGIRQILSHRSVKRVGVPAYTCQVVLDAVRRAGCGTVFYDSGVIPELEDIKKIITKVDALILCYNYGFLPPIDSIVELCKKHKVILIEDCAQAFAARYKRQLVGSFGDYAVYSFGLSKNVGFCGGLILSREPMKLVLLKKFPRFKLLEVILEVLLAPLIFNKYVYPLFFPLLNSHLKKHPERLNYSCPLFARKVILKQMERYDTILGVRSRNAEYSLSSLNGLVDVVASPHGDTAWLYLVLRSKNRAELRKKLLNEGVDMGRMLTFKCLDGISPKALEAEKEVLTIALYRPLSEMKYIVKVLKKVCADGYN